MTKYSKLDSPEVLSHLFHPVPETRTPLPENCREFDCTMKDGTVIGCRFHIANKEAPTILYFHGNGENVSDYDSIAPKYAECGMNILVTTYRGYGWSEGSPTVTTMFLDAEEIFLQLLSFLQSEGFKESVFIMGRSLGSAPAIELAAKHQKKLKGLLIESGFSDTVPLLNTLGLDTDALGISEEDGFGNCDKISEVEKTTLIMHGARDALIPPASAEKLQSFGGARGKQFIIIPGAEHNTTIAVGGDIYFTTIKSFVDKACGVTNWQYRRRKYKKPV